MTFTEEYLDILERLVSGELDPPPWVEDPEAFRRSAERNLEDFPGARNAARRLVTAHGSMGLDEDRQGIDPGRRSEEPENGRSTMGWRERLLRSIEDVAERTARVENTLRASGHLDGGDGPRADNRRSGGGVGFDVQPILSGRRGEAAVDGEDARAENRAREKAARSRGRKGGGVSFDVTPVMSGPAGEAVVDD